VQVVIAERPDNELADKGCVLFEERVAKPMRGAGEQVREDVAEQGGRENEPGGDTRSDGNHDAGEEGHEERARCGHPNDLKRRERRRLRGHRPGRLRRFGCVGGRRRLSFTRALNMHLASANREQILLQQHLVLE
jgi:hypothetical protein